MLNYFTTTQYNYIYIYNITSKTSKIQSLYIYLANIGAKSYKPICPINGNLDPLLLNVPYNG